jgi:hypothetical protein
MQNLPAAGREPLFEQSKPVDTQNYGKKRDSNYLDIACLVSLAKPTINHLDNSVSNFVLFCECTNAACLFSHNRFPPTSETLALRLEGGWETPWLKGTPNSLSFSMGNDVPRPGCVWEGLEPKRKCFLLAGESDFPHHRQGASFPCWKAEGGQSLLLSSNRLPSVGGPS